MPVYQGTYYAVSFTFKDSDDAVINITGYTFEADFKESRTDTAALVSLTTANGGFVVTDGPNGMMEMRLTAVQTALLPVGRIVFDVLRTDPASSPVYQFGGSFRVKRPVTL
jgi:hypothetical protein